ncbi:hypothetical protein ECC02_008155 [Trypanosoma cruzi]|uniref:Uncharacterized protein n=1 Tax=Trypanosoma cruzi TaxID=5693 RepID=A0A7J6XWM3_TRYCR|nr:hypothetical protein ECC02_008155 [Trypanosoma cruzi]
MDRRWRVLSTSILGKECTAYCLISSCNLRSMLLFFFFSPCIWTLMPPFEMWFLFFFFARPPLCYWFSAIHTLNASEGIRNGVAKFYDPCIVAVGFSGFVGVVAGAYGAHALHGRLTPKQQSAWTTAVNINLIHTAGCLSVLALRECVDPNGPAAKHLNRAFHLLLLGTTLFAGTIYATSLGVPGGVIGRLTPVGGVTLMLGWLTVALAGL